MKTNAARMLEKAGIRFELREYEVDESDLSGLHVAQSIGMLPERVFKTLVVRGDKTGVLVACIPVDRELDLKALAREANKRSISCRSRVQPLTGYIRGGVRPVGMKKRFRLLTKRVPVRFRFGDAGMRGCQMSRIPRASNVSRRSSSIHGRSGPDD